MAIVKDQKEIETLREGGRRLATILDKVIKKIAPGITPLELDQYAEKLIRKGGDEPAFLHYQPKGARNPYPSSLCVSINENVVHGIPGDERLVVGDIVSLDIGLRHKEIITDMAKTIPVGKIDKSAQKLLAVTEEALSRGIAAARAGNRVGDIGHAIALFVESRGLSIVREFGGHGVGHRVHEEPFIPNFGKQGVGLELVSGMVLAIEPIVNEGSSGVVFAGDVYNIKTKDGKRSAHFEHTILISENSAEIITKV